MKRPSFQFYPKDFLSDPNVITMSNEEVGGYIKLLCYLWVEDGELPNDEEFLCKLSGLDKVSLTKVIRCFNIGDNLTHNRITLERKKQDDWRKKCSEAGKKGMKSRWTSQKTKDKVSYKVDITKHNTSSSTSSSSKDEHECSLERSSKSEVKKKKQIQEGGGKKLPNPMTVKIDKLLTHLSAALETDGWTETAKMQRVWGKHLIDLYNRIGRETFKDRLAAIIGDDFKRKNCNSLEYIHKQIRAFIIPR